MTMTANLSGEIYSASPIQDDLNFDQIRQIQKKVSDIFFSGGADQLDDSMPIGACLGPMLAALDWTGEARHLQEALPHFNQVENIDGLRAVLARLNYESRVVKKSLSKLRGDLLPCLFETGDGKLLVVISEDDDGKRLVFDATEKSYKKIKADRRVGEAVLVQQIDFEEERKHAERYGWFQSILLKFKRTFISVFALTFIINVLALVVPVYVMLVYDKAVGAKSAMTLGYLFAAVALVICFDLLLRTIRSRYLAYIGSRMESLITTSAFQQLLHLPLSMTETAPLGSQITRLKQIESVREIFTGSLATTVLDLPFFIVFFIAIWMVGGWLGLVPLVLIVLFAAMALVTIPMTRVQVRHAGETKSQNRNFLIELTAKRDTVRDVGADDVWVDRYKNVVGKSIAAQFAAQNLSMTIHTVSQALVMMAGAATVAIGTLMVMDGSLTPGALIAVMALIWRVLSPVQSLFLSLNRLGQTIESLKQINALMRLKTERRPGQLPTFFRQFKGRLNLQRVSFRYPAGSEPALRGVDLNVDAGEFVAITGPSGAGKSTLLQLMIRLYQPQAGLVRIDDLDLRQLDVAELRQAIGYVPQRPTFFYGTIGQNIKLAHPTATREQMVEALKKIGAWEQVRELPDGLDTRINADFCKDYFASLSQKLTLACALVKDAPIYLMDEPGKNLDREEDLQLMEMFKSLRGQSSLVIVTSRPSHMRLADKVVVMEQGMVVGQGAPDEVLEALMKRK